MSPTVATIIGMVLTVLLPKLGVNLGPEEISGWVQVTLVIVLAAIASVRHVLLKKTALGSKNVNAFGGVKK